MKTYQVATHHISRRRRCVLNDTAAFDMYVNRYQHSQFANVITHS